MSRCCGFECVRYISFCYRVTAQLVSNPSTVRVHVQWTNLSLRHWSVDVEMLFQKSRAHGRAVEYHLTASCSAIKLGAARESVLYTRPLSTYSKVLWTIANGHPTLLRDNLHHGSRPRMNESLGSHKSGAPRRKRRHRG
jgi:hypothetical protein